MKPLAGRRVLVTRAGHQAGDLSTSLQAAGAVPVELPVLEIVPLPLEPFLTALAGTPDWLLYTSVNAVRLTATHVVQLKRRPCIAAIGSATAAALTEAGLKVDLIPETFIGEAVLEALIARGVNGSHILMPAAETIRPVLPDGLRRAGAEVEVIPLYRTSTPDNPDPVLVDAVRTGQVDILTFTSPSSVRNLLHLLGGSFPTGATIACIGPVTANAVVDAGYQTHVVAKDSTASGLVKALAEYEERQR